MPCVLDPASSRPRLRSAIAVPPQPTAGVSPQARGDRESASARWISQNAGLWISRLPERKGRQREKGESEKNDGLAADIELPWSMAKTQKVTSLG